MNALEKAGIVIAMATMGAFGVLCVLVTITKIVSSTL